mmetsp:Transcript_6348/g.13547  ORF Transcript_6348/g.13547 Transcript_6348/m.13547 type:complete len:477 (+) Transcript_6348:207-1637(+)|eukprot:CAMPEP_0185844720 /NCGR_PEP_ID=MMETSP1354-20130828/838_1 /TAXON_ID=708628 /ORGANISM="Erythrolobus madagascarensis, Strain CCMP3276" /LENGTH=476 /DNA_ID=CAMNT_0028544481 /DNA_START=184 /DNA_END=1614 /DNA_ORIENTATION=+
MSKAFFSAKNKVGRTGASISHLKRSTFKFQFEVFVSHVANINLRAYQAVPMLVVIQKREHVFATNPVDATNSTISFRQTLSFELTLFSENSDINGDAPQSFMEKDIKVALRSFGPNGKSIAKVHVDAAKWARVPSGQVLQDLKLSNGSSVSLKVSSRLIASNKPQLATPNGRSSRSSINSSLWSRGKKQEDLASSVADDDAWMNDLENDIDVLENDDAVLNKDASGGKFGVSMKRKNDPKMEDVDQAREEIAAELKKTDEFRTALQKTTEARKAAEDDAAALERKVRAARREKARRDEEEADEFGQAGVFELERLLEDLEREIGDIEESNAYLEEELEEMSESEDGSEYSEEAEDGGSEYGDDDFQGSDEQGYSDEERDSEGYDEDEYSDEDGEERPKRRATSSKGKDGLTSGERELNRVKDRVEKLKQELEHNDEFLRVVDELKSEKLALAVAYMDLEDVRHQLRTLKLKSRKRR